MQKENARRKHNFIGFIYELMQIMAENNVLVSKPKTASSSSN